MANLTSYLLDVRRLLHDASGAFWSDTELTDHINAARERVVRDTGCLRTLQVITTPLSSTGVTASAWAANTAVTSGQFVFSGLFNYQVTASGTTGTTAPPYPSGTTVYPPTTPFADGTAQLTYDSPTEVINFSALPSGILTIDVMNIILYWGNTRVPLQYRPWTLFSASLRPWQNYYSYPVAFSTYGQSKLYIGPSPDQSYAMELDTVILPSPLSLATPNNTDQIIDPFTVPVPFYAAYKAKYTEQSYGEAEIYKQDYTKQVYAALNSTFTRRIPNVYSSPM